MSDLADAYERSVLKADYAWEHAVAPKPDHEHSWAPVLVGLPSPDMFAAAERGEIVLGGCIVNEDDSQEACAVCGAPRP